MKSLYEKVNGSYVEVGDVQIPALISTETKYEIGIWGQRHKEYLKANHRVIYYNLLTQDKLNA
ncbi:MAG: TnpV protein [Eubacterium sp.]|nr:TnpV protein [Eubacterium sp.]